MRPGKKKGSCGTPFCFESKPVLTVVDVHSDFKTETQVCIAWCFPFHVVNLQKLC